MVNDNGARVIKPEEISMKHTLSAFVLAACLTLAGCASVFTPLTPGMPVQEVIALKGQPAHPVSGRQYNDS